MHRLPYAEVWRNGLDNSSPGFHSVTRQWIYNGIFMAQAYPSKLCRARIARDTVLALAKQT